jgi:hypothetical protein
MGDFLKRVTRRPSELVEVDGTKIEVRGLSVGEMNNLRRKHKGDEDALGLAIICASCLLDGKPVFDETNINDVMPQYLGPLVSVVNKINGQDSGNSRATGGEGSSSD